MARNGRGWGHQGGEAGTEEGLLHDPVSFGGDENAWELDSSGGCVTLNARHTRDGHFPKQRDGQLIFCFITFTHGKTEAVQKSVNERTFSLHPDLLISGLPPFLPSLLHCLLLRRGLKLLGSSNPPASGSQ